MASSRTVIVAGAGIGGLTTALALAKHGFRATVLDQAPQLLEIGAGIQLSPNAAGILVSLGLKEALDRVTVTPSAIRVRTARGKTLTEAPLGPAAAARYGAPYWVLHRGDLQTALREAVLANPDIELKLGTVVEDFVVHGHGVTAACRRGAASADESGIALVAADGLWSRLRQKLGHFVEPAFAHHTAWRALVPADRVPPALRANNVNLWLGEAGHLVHYPVSAGKLINIVAIVADTWDGRNWSEPGTREDLLTRFANNGWCDEAWNILALPEQWQKWAVHDLATLSRWGHGPITMLGDAAHPTLPFLAQGAAMAIEDAAVLASSLARQPQEPAEAFRGYELLRRGRTKRVQSAARKNGHIYHLDGIQAVARDWVLKLNGHRMLQHYDWLYDWRPRPFL